MMRISAIGYKIQRLHSLKRLTFLFAPVLSLIFLSSCATGGTRGFPNLSTIELREYGITLYFPSLWSLNYDGTRRLHLIAEGVTPDGIHGSMEYRGIGSDQNLGARDLYAQGWYAAMSSNFDGFEMISKDKTTSADNGDTYLFEGRFKKGGDPYRVVGRLRFREGRVHTFYYICEESGFNLFREILESLDQNHKYFKVGSKPS